MKIGLKDDVIRCHRRNPDWTAQQIAAQLGTSDSYVRATAQRNGLLLPLKRGAPPRKFKELATICVSGERAFLDQVKDRAKAAGMQVSEFVRRALEAA